MPDLSTRRPAAARKAPTPTTELQGAILAFVDLALAELQARGEVATQARLAEVVGSTAPQVSSARQGKVGSWDTLIGWMKAWSAAGYTPVRLVIEGDRAPVVQSISVPR